MPIVTFAKPYNFTPPEDRRVAIAYPAGYRGNVRKVCAELAKAAGALEEEADDGSSGAASGEGDVPATEP